MPLPPECVIRIENGDHVLRDRRTRAEHARGSEADVLRAASGVFRVVDALLLRPVILVTTRSSGYVEFNQDTDEAGVFNGRLFAGGELWTDGMLFPDRLSIGFTERLADVPFFTAAVQTLTGRRIEAVHGTASLASTASDPPLLGDWIRAGTFSPVRLARRFDAELGGRWVVRVALRYPSNPNAGYDVVIDRLPGT